MRRYPLAQKTGSSRGRVVLCVSSGMRLSDARVTRRCGARIRRPADARARLPRRGPFLMSINNDEDSCGVAAPPPNNLHFMAHNQRRIFFTCKCLRWIYFCLTNGLLGRHLQPRSQGIWGGAGTPIRRGGPDRQTTSTHLSPTSLAIFIAWMHSFRTRKS